MTSKQRIRFTEDYGDFKKGQEFDCKEKDADYFVNKAKVAEYVDSDKELPRFSFYDRGIQNTIPSKEISITDFISLLKQPNTQVDGVRKEPDKDKRQKLKSKLSYVTFAGEFHKRAKEGLKRASGFACLDVDDIKNLDEVKQKLIENKYTHLLFVSPSGNGFKVVVKIPEVKTDEEYKKYWISIARHYDLNETDEASKDISRACYISIDPEPYFNPDSETYTDKIEDISIIQTATPRKKIKGKDKTRSATEYRKILELLREGKSQEEIYKIMGETFVKWASSSDSYKEYTLEKARKYVEERIISNAPVVVNEKEIPEKYLKILKSPDLFNMLLEQSGLNVAGEETARKIIIVTAMQRLLKNGNATSSNLLVQDDSGKGKDHVTKETLKAILPEEIYLHRTRISPTAFTYWHKPRKDKEGNLFDYDWTWDGKVVYLEDCDEALLNCNVLKTMMSGGTISTIVIKQVAYDIEIKGKPVIVLTSASATPNPELIRRVLQTHLTDEGSSQTKDVMLKQASFRQAKQKVTFNQDLIDCQKYLERVSVNIPYAEALADLISSDKVIMRTVFTRILDIIGTLTALHQYDRDTLDTLDTSVKIATLQDYELARKILLPLIEQSGFIQLTKDQEAVLSIFKSSPVTEFTASQILSYLAGRIKTLPTTQARLRELNSYGFIESIWGKDSINRDIEQFRLIPAQEKVTLPTVEQLKNEIDKLSKVSIISKLSIINKLSKVSKVSQDEEDSE